MRFLSNFGFKMIFMCSNNFCHRQDSNLFFKGTIGHVTSECNRPISSCRINTRGRRGIKQLGISFQFWFYSPTSLIRTPKDQNQYCPLYRGVPIIEVGNV